MFRTSGVHHQEESCMRRFCMVCFTCIGVSSPPATLLTPTHVKHNKQKLSLKTLNLRMKPWGSKHVEDVKYWKRVLIWKVCCFVGLCCIIVSQRTVQRHVKYWENL